MQLMLEKELAGILGYYTFDDRHQCRKNLLSVGLRVTAKLLSGAES